ncbi:MAG: threonine ammonia-lyase [Pseudomonadota bacterium]
MSRRDASPKNASTLKSVQRPVGKPFADGQHENIDNAPTLDDIKAAAGRLQDQVMRTPLVRADKLSAMTGADLWLKLENLQYTGAFKERGAYNKLMTLSPDEKQAGVVAASAGNHAQGVALAAKKLGIKAKIVMPLTTPEVKVRQTKVLGAEIVLSGETYDDAQAAAERLRVEECLTLVHPFDDPAVIAGNGTITLEMLEDGPKFDCLIIPIGGGGLISGMALAAKRLNPELRVLGVQTEHYPSMLNALDGENRPMGQATLAEGIAVKAAGDLTRKIVKEVVDDIITVDEPSLERSLSILMNEQKLLVEGAGAAGLAAVFDNPKRFEGRTVGLILCGGNIDQRLISMILMRDLARSGRLARLRVQLIDAPGQLVRVATIIAEQDGNVIDVGHHRVYSDLPAKMTCMDVTIDTEGQAHLDRIIGNLEMAGYIVEIADY